MKENKNKNINSSSIFKLVLIKNGNNKPKINELNKLIVNNLYSLYLRISNFRRKKYLILAPMIAPKAIKKIFNNWIISIYLK
tara:strand:+ start:262 stop:507 length:246 start_codon:yes stop_codon:yes gene_type:complete